MSASGGSNDPGVSCDSFLRTRSGRRIGLVLLCVACDFPMRKEFCLCSSRKPILSRWGGKEEYDESEVVKTSTEFIGQSSKIV